MRSAGCARVAAAAAAAALLLLATPAAAELLAGDRLDGRLLVAAPGGQGLLVAEAFVATLRGADCGARAAAVEDVIVGWRRRQAEARDVAGGAHGGPAEQSRATLGAMCVVFFDGPEALRALVAAQPDVVRVEQDRVVRSAAVAKASPSTAAVAPLVFVPWGLNRVDQPRLPLSTTVPYEPEFSGNGVRVYLVDSGINVMHTQFEVRDESGSRVVRRRAELGVDFVNEPLGPYDNNGHGSHVAGVVAGATFGAAPGAQVVSIKVLGYSGEGKLSSVIKGLAWALDNAKGRPAVVTMSLTTTKNNSVADGVSLGDAIEECSRGGMIAVVAAGNTASDACGWSPSELGGRAAKSKGVISVGATSAEDRRASFSNFGACVDLFAPGVGIVSAWKDGPFCNSTMSGTSTAAPLVAGAAAVLLDKHAGSKPAAMSELFALAARGVVGDAGAGSPNLLLQVPRRAAGGGKAPTPAPTLPPPSELCVGDSFCTANFAAALYGPVFTAETVVAGPLAVASSQLCAATKEAFAGAVVLVARGKCKFFDKTLLAQAQGARAVVLYLDTPGDPPFALPYLDDASAVRIPTFVVTFADGLALKELAGKPVRVGPPQPQPQPSAAPTAPGPGPGPPSPPTPAPAPAPTQACAAKKSAAACAAALGCRWWKPPGSNKARCYTTPAPTPAPSPAPSLVSPMAPACSGTFAQSGAVCKKLGLRICSLAELAAAAPEPKDACTRDAQFVWAKESCSQSRYQAFRRADGKVACFAASTKAAATRCCPI